MRETSLLVLALPMLQLSSHSLITTCVYYLTMVAVIIHPSSVYYPKNSGEEINPYMNWLDICPGMADSSLHLPC